MAAMLNVDRFTRFGESVSGQYSPAQLRRLAEYLAGEEGEIRYSLSGSMVADIAGSQKRCVKCTIYGWFFTEDPVTLVPTRRELAIESRLILVRNESELPPLELESEDEDYVVCDAEMDVMERIEEEILLDLPPAYAGHRDGAKAAVRNALPAEPASGGSIVVSPFARLAELKKK